MTDEELIAKVEDRLRGHRDDLVKGTRVKVLYDEIIPGGTLGRVESDYSVNNRDSLRVLVDPYSKNGERRRVSVWYLNRWQVERVKE